MEYNCQYPAKCSGVLSLPLVNDIYNSFETTRAATVCGTEAVLEIPAPMKQKTELS